MKLSEKQKFLIALPLGLGLKFLAVAVFVSCFGGFTYGFSYLVKCCLFL